MLAQATVEEATIWLTWIQQLTANRMLRGLVLTTYLFSGQPSARQTSTSTTALLFLGGPPPGSAVTAQLTALLGTSDHPLALGKSGSSMVTIRISTCRFAFQQFVSPRSVFLLLDAHLESAPRVFVSGLSGKWPRDGYSRTSTALIILSVITIPSLEAGSRPMAVSLDSGTILLELWIALVIEWEGVQLSPTSSPTRWLLVLWPRGPTSVQVPTTAQTPIALMTPSLYKTSARMALKFLVSIPTRARCN
jgi:hypothetical protein